MVINSALKKHSPVMLSAAMMFVFAMFSREILPAKYFYDSNTIARFFGLDYWSFSDSYLNTAAFYDLIGLGLGANIYSVALLGTSVGVLGILVGYFCFTRNESSLDYTVFLVCCLFIMAVYFSQYTKESILMIFLTVFLIYSKTIRGLFVSCFILLIYAGFYRAYWFLVIFIAILILFLMTLKGKKILFTGAIVCGLLISSYVSIAVQGDYLSNTRTKLNISRIGDVDAESIVHNIINVDSIITDVTNIILVTIRLKVPVEIMFDSGKKFIFSMFQIWILLVVFSCIKRFPGEKTTPLRYKVALALVLAFWTTQGIFEPDFGSALKHQTPLFPLMIYIYSFGQRIQVRL